MSREARRQIRRPRPVANSVAAFLEGPASVRHAMRLIVALTVVTTFLGGVLVYFFDRKDYPTFGDAMWWALQTVTTVGYGDVTPTNAVGRFIGAFFLLYAVAFLSVLTAAITTSFVERARRDRRAGTAAMLDDGDPDADPPDLGAVLAALEDIAGRLDRLERTLGVPPGRADSDHGRPPGE